MKKLTLNILLLIVVLGSKSIFAQNRQNQAQILQKCIELPKIQKYYPLDADGNQKPLIINYWHPVLFPTDLTVIKDGKNVEFREMSAENNKNAEAYFLFHEFDVFQNSSVVRFDYCYTNAIHLKVIEITLELSKAGDNWEIENVQVITRK